MSDPVSVLPCCKPMLQFSEVGQYWGAGTSSGGGRLMIRESLTVSASWTFWNTPSEQSYKLQDDAFPSQRDSLRCTAS